MPRAAGARSHHVGLAETVVPPGSVVDVVMDVVPVDVPELRDMLVDLPEPLEPLALSEVAALLLTVVEVAVLVLALTIVASPTAVAGLETETEVGRKAPPLQRGRHVLLSEHHVHPDPKVGLLQPVSSAISEQL